MSNSNLSDSHQYILTIQEIKEQVIYMTELKGGRNSLNKHFQNAITNYFMEDYASQHLKERMGLKTFKEVKQVIFQKLEEKQRIEQSGTKYMNLINIYYEEHQKQGTLKLYQDSLKQLAFSNDEKHFLKGSSEWITVSWKKANALFVYHHSKNTHLSSIFEIWNDLFPEDPIIKKKKTREERDKERLIVQDGADNLNSDPSVKKVKKAIEKLKYPVDRQSLAKPKDPSFMQRKKDKKQNPRGSDQDDLDCSDKDSPYSYSDNKEQSTKSAFKKKIVNRGKEQDKQQNNTLAESIDVSDSITVFRNKIEQEKGDNFTFDEFVYIPKPTDSQLFSIKQENGDHLNFVVSNQNQKYTEQKYEEQQQQQQQQQQQYFNAPSVVVQPLDFEKLKEKYELISSMEIEQNKGNQSLYNSLIQVRQQQNSYNQQLNQINAHQNMIGTDDFFIKNCSPFQDFGIGDFNNEMRLFEQQKNVGMKFNLPIFNSLTFSAMNINNNNNANFNLFSNNQFNQTFQQQNFIKFESLIQEEQQITNSLQFLKISQNNDKKNPNQSLQVDFERQQDQDQSILFDLTQTEESVYHSQKFKINKNNEEEKVQTVEEKQLNEESYKKMKEFLNQINSLPNGIQQQKMKDQCIIKNDGTFNISQEGGENQSESIPSSSHQTTSDLINSNQFFLKNLSDQNLS